MPTIKIIASSGEVFKGRAPESWQQVLLAHYAALAAAEDWLTRSQALAAITGLPAQPLAEDVSLCVAILKAAPFLLNGPLPSAAPEIPASFTHQGTTYVPAPADLERISGAQMEALTSFLEQAEGNALAAAPHLLACLYKPEGAALTPEVVAASAAAFASLPMATAYPLLLNFWQRSAPLALPIQRYLAVLPVVAQMRNALEALSHTLASPGACWNLRRWLIRRWLRLASKSLRPS